MCKLSEEKIHTMRKHHMNLNVSFSCHLGDLLFLRKPLFFFFPVCCLALSCPLSLLSNDLLSKLQPNLTNR